MKKFILPIGCFLLAFLPNSYAVDKSVADQEFVNAAARGGKMEVELGHIAQKNGSSAEVKQFGGQMVTDHTKLNDELGAAAKASGLQVPTDLEAKQKEKVEMLSKESGKKFDKEYLDLMVKAHSEDLAAFEKAEATTKDPGLKKAIAGALPVIKHHLMMVKAAAHKEAA